MIGVDTLSIEAIRRHLDTEVVARHVYLFGDVASTNDVLGRLAASGAGDGTTVLAEGQSDARGRHGRAWFSPSGVNLYASVLFRHGLAPRDVAVFSFTGSLAVADAIKDLGLHPAIKWPNDVLLDRKKVGGALIECAMRGDAVEFLIVGVGVNLNVGPAALREALGPAGLASTSVSAALGADVDRNAFAASYLKHLDAWVQRFRAEGPAPIVAAWRQRDILTGRRVEVRGERESYTGRVLGVDATGHLLVEGPATGRPRAVLNEEIRVLD